MNNKFISFMMFVLGVAVGSAVTWKYVKEKYEQIAQEEIDSVKEMYLSREVESREDEPSETVAHVRNRAEQAKDKPSVAEYAAKLREQGYTNYSNPGMVVDDDAEPETDDEEENESMSVDKPYTIPPEEFGELYDYEKISLIYYADGVLADDDDELVDDIEEVVGTESLKKFGEYEDDSVFVRNDRMKCDYEILFDQRKYSDVVQQRP